MENVTRALMPAAALPAAMVAGSRCVNECAGPDVRPDAPEPVLGREIGHEGQRYVLCSVLRNSAVVLFGEYFTGDVSSASTLVVAVPTFLLDGHYSRDFEAEADEYAFASLASHGISPGRFAEVMRTMQRADPQIRHEAGYLSTHPPTVDRSVKAREAAERFQREREDGNQ